MTRTIIAGLGNMGLSHAMAHHQHPDSEIVGLVNRSPIDLPAALADYPRFTSFDDAMATDPALVVVATYSDSHADYA